jgi:hypothetical protein
MLSVLAQPAEGLNHFQRWHRLKEGGVRYMDDAPKRA